MANKLFIFFGLLFIILTQATVGHCAFVMHSPITNTPQAAVQEVAFFAPHGHCSHSYHYHHYHNDHFLTSFFREKDKNWASWSMFFDYFLIGPAGTVCGAVGLMRHNQGAALGMTIGIIETTVEAACIAM